MASDPSNFARPQPFADLGQGRTRLTLHAVFPSAAERERAIKAYRADEGALETLSCLADHLAKLTP